MKLYMEIIEDILMKEIENSYKKKEFDFNKVVNDRCYIILEEIIRIIKDDSLNDRECFNKIEKIVSLLEENNIATGNRHDF